MASHKNGVPAQTGEAAPTSSTAVTLSPSTSGVQAPVQTVPPTVAVPIDLLGKLFKAMRPDLDVSQALAFITQAPVPVQPQTQPTTPAVQAIPLTTPSTTPATQPILETTPSSTHPTTTGETASAVEAAVAEAAAVEVMASTKEVVAPEVVVEPEAVVPDTREVEKEAEPAAKMVVETSGKAPEESQPAEAAQSSTAREREGVQTTQEVDEEVGREEEAEGGQPVETTDQEKDAGREEEAEAESAGAAAKEGADVASEDERMEDQVTDLTVDQPEELEEIETGPIIEVPKCLPLLRQPRRW